MKNIDFETEQYKIKYLSEKYKIMILSSVKLNI